VKDKYTLVHEGLSQWINSPNNGGDCCQTWADTVDELNRLLARIQRLEEAGDALFELCDASPIQFELVDQIPQRLKAWEEAKEAKS